MSAEEPILHIFADFAHVFEQLRIWLSICWHVDFEHVEIEHTRAVKFRARKYFVLRGLKKLRVSV